MDQETTDRIEEPASEFVAERVAQAVLGDIRLVHLQPRELEVIEDVVRDAVRSAIQ